MSEENVYIGGTSIQIGEHGFINQPKEIIEYIKYLQKQLQQKENIIKEAKKNNQYIIDVINDIKDGKRLIELLSKTNEILENGGEQ